MRNIGQQFVVEHRFYAYIPSTYLYYTLCHHHHPTPPIHTFVLISDAVQRDTRLDAVQTIEPPQVQNLSELKSLDRSVLTQHSWLQGDIEILMSSLHDTPIVRIPETQPLPRRDFPRLEPRGPGGGDP